jgi:metallophosphoesterase (TIGR00282 family)
MRILFIGDIVGKSGRDIVSSLLYSLKDEFKIDLVIANGENSAHGKGITIKIYRQLLNEGIDYITLGNHAFSKGEILNYLDETDRIVFPYNHIKRTDEAFFRIISYKGLKFCLTNILGEAFMNETSMDPYKAFEEVVETTSAFGPDFYFVDLHGETTAEKRMFAEYFKDKARAVVGTHTHVQTADEDILKGCAFITDVGMCGAYDSVIGRDVEETIAASIRKEKTRYTIAEGPAIFCAVVIDFDEIEKIPVSIQRIQIRPEENQD